MDSKIVEAYKFFREHAGWGVGENGVGALSLARAEAWAEERGMTFDWEYEDEPWYGDEPLPENCELLCCIARDADRSVVGSLLCCIARDADRSVVGSLGMIAVMPDGRAYRRVIEAELASEYRYEQEKEARDRAAAANQNIRTAS